MAAALSISLRPKWAIWVALLSGLSVSSCGRGPANADEPTFAGDTIRIIVGFASGGTYDLHARLAARHLGRHLPGQPVVIVENMPGAGGIVAANYLSHVAAPDGKTIAMLAESNVADLANSHLVDQLHFLGSPSPIVPVFVFSPRSGIGSVDDWRHARRPPRFASSGVRAMTSVVPRVAAAALGLPMTMVQGYAGSSEMRLALEGGEVDAVCLSWDTLHKVFGSSPVNVVLQFSPVPIAGLAAPDARTIATDPRTSELLEAAIYDMNPLGRFLAVPRAVPEARLRMLRDALMQTWADPAFVAEAAAAGLVIQPVAGDALEQSVQALAGRREVVSRINTLLSEQ